LKDALPQAGYGQGQVIATPFQMARAAATVAAGGAMPYGRWVLGQGNNRDQEPQRILPPESARFLAAAMRRVVTEGTGRRAAGSAIAIAGKTGTAEIEKGASHAWFVGFAPAEGPRKIAFAILVENGQYGGAAAAPLAPEIAAAAQKFGYFSPETSEERGQ
jgi:peptidoglycan glycosyltransferase